MVANYVWLKFLPALEHSTGTRDWEEIFAIPTLSAAAYIV